MVLLDRQEVMVKIVDSAGRDLHEAASSRLHEILSRLNNSGKAISDGLLWTVRHHFKTIYPGSQHYNPDKVQPNETSNGENPSASVTVDVPGVTRAYHDMHIRPKFRKYLSIPIHRSSYGKSPRQFNDLVFIQKKNGNKLLAQNLGTGLVFLFALKSYVF